MKVLSLPRDDRPREKLFRFGAGVLSDAELLALILVSGTKGKNVVELSREALERLGGLGGLLDASTCESEKIVGLGKNKMAALLAVGEIARRLAAEPSSKKDLFEAAEGFVRSHYDGEECHLFLLDGRGKVEESLLLCKGKGDSIRLSPQDILTLALRKGASRFALLHVHPSGISLPSKQDILLTRETLSLSIRLGLTFLDHLIASSSGVYSFREQGVWPS